MEVVGPEGTRPGSGESPGLGRSGPPFSEVQDPGLGLQQWTQGGVGMLPVASSRVAGSRPVGPPFAGSFVLSPLFRTNQDKSRR